MLIKDGDYSFFIKFPRTMTLEEFLEAADVVKNSYAESFFERIYDCITQGVVDVYKEYEKYYSKEYESIGVYLLKKYQLKSKMIKEILDFDGEKFKLLYQDGTSDQDWGMSRHIIFNDDVLPKINKILINWGKDEN